MFLAFVYRLVVPFFSFVYLFIYFFKLVICGKDFKREDSEGYYMDSLFKMLLLI